VGHHNVWGLQDERVLTVPLPEGPREIDGLGFAGILAAGEVGPVEHLGGKEGKGRGKGKGKGREGREGKGKKEGIGRGD
jgi:hypothetical protein